ncbi:hypothetical protein HDU89_006741 [Geranomyces variabilis]|nr:hypothetical protein HDU89_006741 [Geranomyces variabilis]
MATANATPQSLSQVPMQQRQGMMIQPQMYSAAQQQAAYGQPQQQQQQQQQQYQQQFSQPMDRSQLQHLLNSIASPMDGYQMSHHVSAPPLSSVSSSYQPQHLHNQQPAYYMQQAQPQQQQYHHQQQQQQSSAYYASMPPVSVPAFRPSNFNVPFPHSNMLYSNGSSPLLIPSTPRRAPQVPRRPANFNPPREGLYEATYAGLPVYELISPNGTGIMRRKIDSWMNATQILKAAGIEKSRRTRVLEREIHQGEHEKIQGGYGKYQGTWIPLWRARELVGEYGLGPALNNILDIPE